MLTALPSQPSLGAAARPGHSVEPARPGLVVHVVRSAHHTKIPDSSVGDTHYPSSTAARLPAEGRDDPPIARRSESPGPRTLSAVTPRSARFAVLHDDSGM